jgi:glutathione S-transferase
MDLKLYVIPGSHPCATVEAALALKGLEYERVDQLPGASPLLQQARFGRRTVPGLVVDGYKVSGSRLILRTLEGLKPDPPLYPSDPDEAHRVDEAERWGDTSLQTAVRFIIALALTRSPAAGDTFIAGANIPALPAPLSAQATRAIFGLELRLLAGGREGAHRALDKLPGLLDRVDELIDEGVLGGKTPNAADLQIAGSVRLLLTMADVRDEIDRRPAGVLARRLIPRFPGDVPAGSLPPEWIPSLGARETAAAAPA